MKVLGKVYNVTVKLTFSKKTTGADSYSQPFLPALTVTVDFYYRLCGSSAILCTVYHNINNLGVGN